MKKMMTTTSWCWRREKGADTEERGWTKSTMAAGGERKTRSTRGIDPGPDLKLPKEPKEIVTLDLALDLTIVRTSAVVPDPREIADADRGRSA